GPVWMLVGSQLLMGAGFGLISTPLVVGVHSIVGWHRRGVATGASMFSRYFGQTLGAALFAAVITAVSSYTLQQVPADLLGVLPEANQVIEALQSNRTTPATLFFLRQTFHSAVYYVYIGLLISATATSLLLL